MGCDIHFHSEVKRNGKWLHHSEANVSRNYVLFAKMAGVRNYYNLVPISEPKGLPDDVTELTKLHSDRFGVAGHSHSWLDAKEIVELHNFIGKSEEYAKYDPEGWKFAHRNFPYFLGTHLNDFSEHPEDWETTGIEDVRYVFFFDN